MMLALCVCMCVCINQHTTHVQVGCRMKPNEHYMDYTGSSVYCQSQIEQVRGGGCWIVCAVLCG